VALVEGRDVNNRRLNLDFHGAPIGADDPQGDLPTRELAEQQQICLGQTGCMQGVTRCIRTNDYVRAMPLCAEQTALIATASLHGEQWHVACTDDS